VKLNTSDLQQLSVITRSQLHAQLQGLIETEAGITPLKHLLSESENAQSSLSRTLIFLLHRMYDCDVEALYGQLQRLAAMSTQFVELYGDGPVSLLRAPARINILGEHVDYVSYLPTEALPFGSREHDMLMLYRASPTDRVRGASTLKAYQPFSFTYSDGPAPGSGSNPETDWLSFLFEQPATSAHWSNYVKGPVFFARIKSGAEIRRGFDFVVDSAIPAGGGASSSSALVVLASSAVQDANGIKYEPLELARDAAKAEWYVGTRGGAMDHITISLARRDHAILISFLDQQARQVALPGRQFRWITFFSKAADKGRDVMIEYNERAAVSRIMLPALIEGWKTKQPTLYTQWLSALRSLEIGAASAVEKIETLLQALPSALTLTEIGQEYPEAFAECARSFPILVSERARLPLQVRTRALHHIGEVGRVKTAVQLLENLSRSQSGRSKENEFDAGMHLLGTLLDESHTSLRDLYEVSNPEVERLLKIIRPTPGVYGARLMGGGFGGNVLVLTTEESVASLIERVQTEYYGPQNRQGLHEGSVMVSTPGDGLASIDVESAWREAIEDFNSSESKSVKYRAAVNATLDSMPAPDHTSELWPVIVAAGKGSRSLASGLATPKPVAPILGAPAIIHVLRSVRAAFSEIRRPIVIVSPENESPIRALLGEEVTFVVQPEALGTGDAVLCAHEQMQNFMGRVLVIWGTQPVVRPETMRRTLKLAELFATCEMVLPTAYKESPYAPLLRDQHGTVQAARETHLEQAEPMHSGESNIGMFLLKSEAMFEALVDLKQRYWDEKEQRYNRPGGELGFPNELINYFAGREHGVFAAPIADWREEQGIKTLADIPRCERFISELVEQ
jgi:galactokinase/CTP:molybdopterin cytidylyltransferase MocA